MNRKVFFLILLSFSCVLIQAQQISVKSFRKLDNDLSARTFSEVDQNGEMCAIIKVVTTAKDLVFEGDGNGIVTIKENVGEYWIYISHGSHFLTIKHHNLGTFRYSYETKIEKACVYELSLSEIRTTSDTTSEYPFLTITTEPENALIYIDDKFVGQGICHLPCGVGKYTYRVESPFYHAKTGTIEMRNDEKTINVKLKEAFGYLHIRTLPRDGASITIDGILLDSVTPLKSGRLQAGKHFITVVRNGYYPVKQEVIVAEGVTKTLEIRMKEIFECGEILIDERDGQRYKTRQLSDERCWMIENLRFGQCDAKIFDSYSLRSAYNKIAPGYYGVCLHSIQAGVGNLYNWQAVMNVEEAAFHRNPSGNVDGNSPVQWQGICPEGWHIPSGGSTGEFQQLYTALHKKHNKIYPGKNSFEGLLWGKEEHGYYWSSTYNPENNRPYYLESSFYGVWPNQNGTSKNFGFAVRCIKDY